MSFTTKNISPGRHNNIYTKMSNKPNSKKSKRTRPTPTEQYHQECKAHYSKLHHVCSKLLHKEGKVVKSFECQKIVRAIKAANDLLVQSENSAEGKELEKAKKKVATLELKLERAKKLELDALVSVALKRLGVCSLDPINSIRGDEEEADPTAADEEEGDKQSAATQKSQEKDQFYTTLIEQMLRHKRLSTAMDQINDKVSEYQSWANHREQVILGGDKSEPKRGKKKKKQQSSSKEQNETLIVAGGTKRRKIDLGGHEGTSGLFIGSLSGQKVDGYSDDDDGDGEGYNDEDHELYNETKKKNRPGQRARKAKAMAIEAKKAGKTWDSSINWREKKEEQNQDYDRGSRRHQVKNDKRRGGKHSNDGSQAAREGSTKPTKAKSQDIATMGKSWKEDGKAHPSWAAAAAQKSQGIVEFKGTKITF
jgi:hypothetical protein